MNLDKLTRFISWAIMVSSYVVLYITFLRAYLSPNIAASITINGYGEANFELILLTLVAPFIWYGGNDYLLEVFRKA